MNLFNFEALIYSDDPDKIEMAIKSVEKLCDSFHFELQEICVELLKVLLHKSNQFAIKNFDDMKMTAMISVTVHYPKESAQYLTSQFYEAGYTLTQRIDILHVLVVSIQKLSSPNEAPIFDRRLFANSKEQVLSNLIPFNKSNETESSWRQIVEKRIAEKTKIKKVKKIKHGDNYYYCTPSSDKIEELSSESCHEYFDSLKVVADNINFDEFNGHLRESNKLC